MTDTVASYSAVNNCYFVADKNLDASIITQNVDDSYPVHSKNHWSFHQVHSEDAKSLPNNKRTSFDKVTVQLLKS